MNRDTGGNVSHLGTVTRLLKVGLGVWFSNSEFIMAGKVWWSSWWQNHAVEVLYVTADKEAESRTRTRG